MKIVLMSKPKFDELEIPLVVKLFECGLETYHLRKPRMGTKEMKELILKIPKQFHSRIIVHSHHQLARQFKLKGVHYTRVHQKKTFKNKWRNFRLGLSSGAFVRTASATKLASLYDQYDIDFDYIFLSPVFDSLTGKFQSGFYEDGIRAAVLKSGKNIVARGGVDVKRLEKVKDLGLYGIALGSCIWDSPEPVKEFEKILARCRELEIPID